MKRVWLLVYTVLISLLHARIAVVGFNFDIPRHVRYEGTKGSMFGFSIAVHRNNGSNWVIVGAPKLHVSRFPDTVPYAGGVYRCGGEHCFEVPFDSKGNQFNDRGEQIDTKAHQWLGATVASGGENGLVVACAPRYVFHTMQPSRAERIEPVGTCFTAKDFTTFTEYSPCRTSYLGFHRQGSCQAGFSAAITRNSRRVFIGAPGSWYWQGQVYSINTAAKFPYKPPNYDPFGSGQMYMYDVTDPKSKVFATKESDSKHDDSYFGYSLTTGNFNGGSDEGVAVGMPRGASLHGVVAIYTWNMINERNITGTQIGAYFGYSVCSVDIDADGLDDLIIGAPMHTEPNNDLKYDVGRVYIMMQGKTDKFRVSHIRDGIKSRGRFGLAITSLGDANRDGWGDFAVGAPYDGDEERGAVYIFYGSEHGPLEKPSQVIYAEKLPTSTYVRTFGFSLAGGLDIDGNTYPDLAVGAYDSDAVFIFKSRPVVTVIADVAFRNKLINLERNECEVYRPGYATCAYIKWCLTYSGHDVPLSMNFDISWVLDVKSTKKPRMFFITNNYPESNKTFTHTLRANQKTCHLIPVYISSNIVDKLTAFEVEMSYDLTSLPRYPRSVPPIIDEDHKVIQKDSANIQTNCGPDNICYPDLKLDVKTVENFLIKRKERNILEFDITITNAGEDAFEATFYMIYPKDLALEVTKQVGERRDISASCSLINIANVLKCDLGNPFPANQTIHLKINLSAIQTGKLAPSYNFFMEVNSTNPETDGNRFDNIYQKDIGVRIEAEISVGGISYPETVHYDISEYKSVENATHENDLGPQVVHIYNVKNSGPSDIEKIEIYIIWPYVTFEGRQLMYLLQAPETNGSVRCDPNIYINERNLLLDDAASRRSYLRIKKLSTSTTTNRTITQGILVEHSSNNTVFPSSDDKAPTEETRRKLKEEETVASSGDASLVHTQRAKEAAAASETRTGTGQVSVVQSSSTTSVSHPPLIHYEARNRTIIRGQDGHPLVVESSTEYYREADGHVTYVNSNQPVYSSPQSGYSHEIRRTSQSGPTYHNSATYGNYGHNQNEALRHQGRANNAHVTRSTNVYQLPTISTFDKVAQGQGFRAGGVGMENLARVNVDDEVRRHSSSPNFETSHSSYRSQYSPHPDYNANSHKYNPLTHEEYAPSKSTIDDLDNKYNEEYDEYEEIESDGGDGGYYAPYMQPNAGHSAQRQNLQRLKRQISNELIRELEDAVHCKATRCALLRCEAKSLAGVSENNTEGDSVSIGIRTRLVAETMTKLSGVSKLNISTMVVARVTRLPHIGTPKEKLIRSHEIFTTIQPKPQAESDVVPLWVVVLSACAGAIILLLLIFLLYKCGFFNRNRPSDSSERQPLNSRNGYHGDEHL